MLAIYFTCPWWTLYFILHVLLMDPDWGFIFGLALFCWLKLWAIYFCCCELMLSTLILVLGKWTLFMLRCVAAATLWSCDLGTWLWPDAGCVGCILVIRWLLMQKWWLCILCPYRVDMHAAMILLSCCGIHLMSIYCFQLDMIRFGVYLLFWTCARSNWSIPILFALLLLYLLNFCCLLLFLFEFAKPQSKWT